MTEPLHARIRRRADLAMERGECGEAAMLDWLADEADSIVEVTGWRDVQHP